MQLDNAGVVDMDKGVGYLPPYRGALLDIILATPRERRFGKAEAYRVNRLHGSAAHMWVQAALRSPALTRRSRRSLGLAYWYLSLGITPPEHWRLI
ncbi:MAG: hypothetical protein JWO65_2623 [Sphingomonas bacterium]|jgi:hypothetical protein|nr:hypothetical protein [Sphingomonas bacterium]